MTLFITQMPRWLIKNLLLLAIFSLIGCRGEAGIPHGRLATKDGKLIKVELALTDKTQKQGLSGRKAGSLKANQGMLFVYDNTEPRSFWMPDTYFDLDIFFLNKDLTIVHIERDVPHHPGRKEPPAIARTKAVNCQYVLELDAASPLSKKLLVGQKLKWLGSSSLSKIKLKTHP
ncbi:MAG: hypothetical protein CME70_04980 [Halobacteriovorax sp.]|nr:hypothetical protein [Halobacteriovorax sp.]|tara:strand:- start:4673 stop:5194 length:522 start_codon:yes stop_codon:yes gene_type:complete